MQPADEKCCKAICEKLEHFGLNPEQPTEMQKDFAFLRDLRTASESVRSKALLTIVVSLVGGLISAVWFGIKHYIHQ